MKGIGESENTRARGLSFYSATKKPSLCADFSATHRHCSGYGSNGSRRYRRFDLAKGRIQNHGEMISEEK
ncbi:MAG: hypothetical protein ACLFSB_13465 [Chitinispirillaceae bacterium]